MRTKTQIQREIAETEAHLVDLREELAKYERQTSRRKSDAYQNRKDMLERMAPVIENLIQVGDLVEVTGSKAGRYRRIVRITKGSTYGANFHCGTIHGHVVYDKRVRQNGKIEWERVEDVTKITTHGTNKIVAVYKNGEWHKTKDMAERLLPSP